MNSPNYPSRFPENIECAWTITVEKGKNILIKFVDIDFSEPCHLSYVRAWDGYVENPDKPDFVACQRLSFYLKGEKYFLSKTNRIVIKFNGNKANSTFLVDNVTIAKTAGSSKKEASGFLLTWTAVYEDKDCRGFLCKGGELCIDSRNSICQKTVAYCINSSLVCDGYSHCNVNDDSDETNCNLSFRSFKLKMATVSLLVVLTVVLLMFVLGVLTFRQVKLGKLQKSTLKETEPKNVKLYCAKPNNRIFKFNVHERCLSASILEKSTDIQRKKDQALFRVWKSDPVLYKQLFEHLNTRENMVSSGFQSSKKVSKTSKTIESGLTMASSLVSIQASAVFNNRINRRNSSYAIALNL